MNISRIKMIRFLLLLGILGLLLYSMSMQAGFQYDDYKMLVNNPFLRQTKDIFLIWKFDPTRFLAHYSFAFNSTLAKDDLFSYHLINVLLHIATTWASFFFLRQLFSFCQEDQHKGNKSLWIIFFSCCLFLCHPLQTEAVTYIVQRSTVLVALFVFLSLTNYLLYRQLRRKFHYVLSLFFAFLGTMAKPNIIILPILILLIESMASSQKRRDVKETLREVLPYFLVIILVAGYILIWRYGSLQIQGIFDVTRETDKIGRFEYFLTQLTVVVRYIGLMFLPISQNLDYDIAIMRNPFAVEVFFSFIILSAILIWALRMKKNQPLIYFSCLWFFITLIPESSIFPLSDVMFEHRLYLPLFGFTLLISYAIIQCIDKKRLFIIVLSVIVAFFSFLTVKRNFLWADQRALLEDTLEKSPQKARPYNNLGDYYFQRGHFEIAEQFIRDGILKEPDEAGFYYNLGVVLQNQGRWQEAKEYYRKAIDMDPFRITPYCYLNMGNLFLIENNLDKAQQYWQSAANLYPRFFEAYINLGNLYVKKENYEQALQMYQKALEIFPVELDALNGLASSLVLMEDYRQAHLWYEKILEMYPDNIMVYNNLGNLYVRMGELEKAEEVLLKAINLKEDHIPSYENLANVYRGLKKPEKARRALKQAARICEENNRPKEVERIRKRL